MAILKDRNEYLLQRLQMAEQQLKERDRQDTAKDSELQQELVKLHSLLEQAAVEKVQANLAADNALLEAQNVREVMACQFLSEAEQQDAAVKCCWLAHYWGLMAKHGLLPEVAQARAARWRAAAPDDGVLRSMATQYYQQLSSNQSNDAKSTPGQASTIGSQPATTILTTGDKPRPYTTTADLLQLEQAMREAAELRLPEAALTALAMMQQEQSMLRSCSLTSQADIRPCQDAEAQPVNVGAISTEEVAEVAFQAAWLTYHWSHAALKDVEPQVAEERAHFWAGVLSRKATTQDLVLLHQALQELRMLGVEQQLWQQRSRRQQGAS